MRVRSTAPRAVGKPVGSLPGAKKSPLKVVSPPDQNAPSERTGKAGGRLDGPRSPDGNRSSADWTTSFRLAAERRPDPGPARSQCTLQRLQPACRRVGTGT